MDLAKANYLNITNLDSLSATEITKINALDKEDSLFNSHVTNIVALEIKQHTIEQKVASIYKPEVLKQKIEKYILLKNKTIYKYLVSKGVNREQLKNLLKIPTIFNDETAIKNIQFHLLFDINEEEETI